MCLKLAYTDENTDKYNSVPDLSSWQTISMNTVLENESDITEEQINSIVAYLIEKANSSKLFDDDYKLLAAYIDINADTPCACYFQIEHNERKLGFSADLEIDFDAEHNKLSLSFSNAKIGKLPIPKKLVVYVLKKTKLGIAASLLSFEDLSLVLPTSLNFNIAAIDTNVNVEITNFVISEDMIHLETNPIINEAVDSFKDSMKDKIIDFADDHLPGNIGGYLDKFKSTE